MVLGKGHLILFTEYELIDDQTVLLKVKQRQNIDDFPIYKIPTQVAIFSGNNLIVEDIVIDKLEQEFTFEFKGDLKKYSDRSKARLIG